MTLYMLGEVSQEGLDKVMETIMTGGAYEAPDVGPYDYEDFINKEYVLLTTEDFYSKTDITYTGDDGKTYPVWKDVRREPSYDQVDYVTDPSNGIKIKISGIVRPKPGTTATSISGALGYTKALTDRMLVMNSQSEIISQQKETPEYNVLTGMKFERTYYTPENIDELIAKVDKSTMEKYFYPFVTKMILSGDSGSGDVSLSDMLNVHDKNSFLGVFMMLSDEYQAECVSKMIEAAKVNDPQNLNVLCGAMTQMLDGKITVTPDNMVMLMDIINNKDAKLMLLAINGIENYTVTTPMGDMNVSITGLADLTGAESMAKIYEETSTELKSMEVNEEIFTKLLQNAGMFIEDFGNSDTFKQLEETLYNLAPDIDATYESNIELLDDAVKASPASINFYAKDFESKDIIEQFIEDYNNTDDVKNDETKKIQYTDVIGILMSSISTIINVISYVLIAFVSISLVVSSIMIGIITYISVLERTKEIGILRSIGASKKDTHIGYLESC